MSSNLIEIFIDNRENWELPSDFIEKNNYKFIKKNLDVGDIQILKNNKIQIIIERKTLDDLASSIMDGRYEEQKKRLYNLKESGLKIVYLIEGNFTEFYNPYSRIKTDTLKNIYLKFIMRDKVQVIKTNNIHETIDMIKNLSVCIDKCKFDIKHNKDININQGFKKEVVQPENCFAYQLQLIPGISIPIGIGIAEHFPNGWIDLHNFLDDEIPIKKKIKKLGSLTISGINRNIGIKTAEKIIKFCFPQFL